MTQYDAVRAGLRAQPSSPRPRPLPAWARQIRELVRANAAAEEPPLAETSRLIGIVFGEVGAGRESRGEGLPPAEQGRAIEYYLYHAAQRFLDHNRQRLSSGEVDRLERIFDPPVVDWEETMETRDTRISTAPDRVPRTGRRCGAAGSSERARGSPGAACSR